MKSNRTFTITAITLALGLTTSIASADKKKHDEKFCKSLTSLNENLTELKALGPSSTIGEYKTALKETKKDAEETAKQAHKIKSPAAKEFTEAAKQLKTRSNITDDMTVAQAKTQIRDDVQNVEQSAQTLAGEAGCPNAMPGHESGGGMEPHEGTTPQQ